RALAGADELRISGLREHGQGDGVGCAAGAALGRTRRSGGIGCARPGRTRGRGRADVRSVSGLKWNHRVAHAERRAGMPVDLLAHAAVSVEVQLEVVITGLDVQPLEYAVEVVDRS